MKRKVGYFCAAFLFLFGSILLFWSSLYIAFLGWCLQDYCQECLGYQLKFDRIEWRNDCILIENLRLHSVLDQSLILDANSANCVFLWKIWKNQLECAIELQGLKVRSLVAKKDSFISPENKKSIKNSWVKLKGSFKVDQGLVLLDPVNPLPFNLNANFAGASCCDLKCFLGERECLTLSLASENSLCLIECEAKSLPLSSFFPQLKLIFPSLNPYAVKGGNFDGKLSFCPYDPLDSKVSAHLEIHDFEGFHESLKIGLKASVIELNIDEESRDGKFKISEGCVFYDKNPKIRNIDAEMCINQKKPFSYLIHGKGIENDLEFPISLRGEIFQPSVNLHGSTMSFFWEDFSNKEILSGSWHFLSSSEHKGECLFHQFGSKEYGLIRPILNLKSTGSLKEGWCEGNLKWHATLDDCTFFLSNCKAYDLWICFENQTAFKSKLLSIEGAFCPFSKDVWDSFQGSLDVNFGDIVLERPLAAPSHLQNIEGHLEIREGVFQSSSQLRFSYSGLKTEVELEGFGGEGSLDLTMKGPLPDLNFANGGMLLVKASLQKRNLDLVCEGSLRLYENTSYLSHELIGGCTITHVSFFDDALFLNYEKGWFQTEHLPIERYVGPFWLPHPSLSFKGNVSLSGIFDEHGAEIHYHARDLEIESELFKIAWGSHVRKEEVEIAGVYHFDRDAKTFQGNFPLDQGIYYEKKSGLIFHQIQGNLIHQPGLFRADEIEAFIEGIYIAGSLELIHDPTDIANVELKIFQHTLSGKFSNAERIFSRFRKFFFSNLSLQGNLGCGKEGGFFYLRRSPEGFQVDFSFDGNLSEGTAEAAKARLHDLGLNFKYDYGKNLLDLSEIQSTVIIGDADQIEELSLSGDHILFTDFLSDESNFDLWISDRQRDVIRLVGSTKKNENSSLVQFTFDPQLCHFGPVHPYKMSLCLKDWAEIQTFDFQLSFSLETFLRDLQRLDKAGLLGLSRSFSKEFQNLKNAKGALSAEFHYLRNSDSFSIQLIGNELEVEGNHFKELLVNARQQNFCWNVEQFQLDDLSLAADFIYKGEDYDIDFFGFRYGKSILMGFDGKYFPSENLISAHLNLLEVNLENISELPALASFVKEHQLKGKLRGSGKLKIDLFKGSKGFQVEASTKVSLQHFAIGGVSFQDSKPFTCYYSSDRGIIVENFQSSLKQEKKESMSSYLSLEKGGYDFLNKMLWVSSLHFRLAPKQIQTTVNVLKYQFPSYFSPQVCDFVRECKSNEELVGDLNLELCSGHHHGEAVFMDGIYHCGGDICDLKNVTFQWNSDECKINALCLIKNHWFSLGFIFPTELSGSPSCILALESAKEEEFLTFSWNTLENGNICIDSIQGHLEGIGVNLKKSTQPLSNVGILEGDVMIHPAAQKGFFFNEGPDWLSLILISKPITLNGSWELDFQKDNQIHFNGLMKASSLSFQQFYLENFAADVKAHSQNIQLSNVTLKDPAGSIQIDCLDLVQGKDYSWSYHIPKLIVQDFQPSLLKRLDSSLNENSLSLTLRKLEILNLKGNFTDYQSVTCKGMVHFINPARKNASNAFFTLPTDVLTQLGLDLPVLTPVTGMIDYEIREGKVFLTRFKDVYSDNKLVKFYLPKSSSSFIDFSGNLNLRIGLQPYNVIFNFADLFTFSIQGTLTNPVLRYKDDK